MYCVSLIVQVAHLRVAVVVDREAAACAAAAADVVDVAAAAGIAGMPFHQLEARGHRPIDAADVRGDAGDLQPVGGSGAIVQVPAVAGHMDGDVAVLRRNLRLGIDLVAAQVVGLLLPPQLFDALLVQVHQHPHGAAVGHEGGAGAQAAGRADGLGVARVHQAGLLSRRPVAQRGHARPGRSG